jgi:hypothetical protein
MPKWRSWEATSKAEWGMALEREAVIRPLAEQARLSTQLLRTPSRAFGLAGVFLCDSVRDHQSRLRPVENEIRRVITYPL